MGQADPRFSNHIIWRFFDKIRGMISKKLLFRTLFALLLLAGLLGAVIVPSLASVGHMPQLVNNPNPCTSSLQLVINEVGWMGTSSTNTGDQWVEFYNPGASPLNLSGWTFTIVDTSTDIPLDGTKTIPAHGYFLLANIKDEFKDVTIDQVDSNLSLTPDGEILQLTNSGSLIDHANWWDGYWPAGIASNSIRKLAYSSMERYCPPSGIISADSPSAWVTFAGPTANTPLDRNGNHVRGTPGRLNWASPPVTETPTPIPPTPRKPTPTIAPTPIPAVVINEILPRPGSDWNGDGEINNGDEFIEVENLGPGIATLTNWTLQVNPNNGNGSYTIPSLQLPPNGRKVFFGSKTQLLLKDSGETVTLTNTSGVVEDAFTYPAILQPDDSWCRMRDGIGPWQDGCFPTPGLENSLSGVSPNAPPTQPGQYPPCNLPDTAPIEFVLGECYSPGGGIYNPDYWNGTSEPYWIPDPNSKFPTHIQ